LKAESCHPGFQPHDKKLKMFQGKILIDDLHAEFHMHDLLKVCCSACTLWLTMRALYDTKRWKEHWNSNKCKARQSQKLVSTSISAFFRPASHANNKATTLVKSSPHLAPMPCPGLTSDEYPAVKDYLYRTSILVAEHQIAGQSQSRYGIAQKTLTHYGG
jgi:hypothetical protein